MNDVTGGLTFVHEDGATFRPSREAYEWCPRLDQLDLFRFSVKTFPLLSRKLLQF